MARVSTCYRDHTIQSRALYRSTGAEIINAPRIFICESYGPWVIGAHVAAEDLKIDAAARMAISNLNFKEAPVYSLSCTKAVQAVNHSFINDRSRPLCSIVLSDPPLPSPIPSPLGLPPPSDLTAVALEVDSGSSLKNFDPFAVYLQVNVLALWLIMLHCPKLSRSVSIPGCYAPCPNLITFGCQRFESLEQRQQHIDMVLQSGKLVERPWWDYYAEMGEDQGRLIDWGFGGFVDRLTIMTPGPYLMSRLFNSSWQDRMLVSLRNVVIKYYISDIIQAPIGTAYMASWRRFSLPHSTRATHRSPLPLSMRAPFMYILDWTLLLGRVYGGTLPCWESGVGHLWLATRLYS
jgi:hypothetical protein